MLFNIIIYLLPVAVLTAPTPNELPGDPEKKGCGLYQPSNGFTRVPKVDVAFVDPRGNTQQACIAPQRIAGYHVWEGCCNFYSDEECMTKAVYDADRRKHWPMGDDSNGLRISSFKCASTCIGMKPGSDVGFDPIGFDQAVEEDN
ncbi:Protein of unknown function [Pyronema omphalodes CBS 100304]|uniref:Uncharacterized protein n=1 Tax=Pyronema omphalodes (strain CBS 100304) TaxID=1076935 RepID=U4LQH4_PYROM|nr:Protein of unknown function [Pyronema omphalodes CBS 100304]